MLDVSPSFSAFELSSRRTRYLHTKLRHVRLRSRAETRRATVGERDREIIAKGTPSYLGEIVCFRPAPVAARNVQRMHNGRCIMFHVAARKRRCEMRKAPAPKRAVKLNRERRGRSKPLQATDRAGAHDKRAAYLAFYLPSSSERDTAARPIRRGGGRVSRPWSFSLTSLLIAARKLRKSLADQIRFEHHRLERRYTIPARM